MHCRLLSAREKKTGSFARRLARACSAPPGMTDALITVTIASLGYLLV